MMFEVLIAIAPILVSLLLALLSWGLGEAVLYLRQRRGDDYLVRSLQRLDDAMEDGVRAASMRLGPTWDRIVADGHVDDDELGELRDEALALAREAFGARGLRALRRVLGDDALTATLEARAEAWVQRVRDEVSRD